jgi:hypothetical protein
LLPTLSRTASANGTGLDLQGSNDAEGDAVAILDCGAATAGTNPTYNVKLQDSANNSAFDDITGATFTEVTDAASQQKLSFNTNNVRRYVRAVATIGGTSAPAFTASVTLLFSKKYGN